MVNGTLDRSRRLRVVARLTRPASAAAVLLLCSAASPDPSAADGSIEWAFETPAGYVFDSTRVEVAGGRADLLRDPTWPDPQRPCRRTLTIPAQGCAPAGGLAQIRILLDEASFDFTKTAFDGHDLLLTDESGTALGHWVESFDAAARRALVTAAIPDFAPPETREIRLFYGDSLCAPAGSWESAFLDGMQSVPVLSITSGESFDAFPAVERMLDGDLLVAYRTGSGHVSSDGALMLARSSDEGESWTTSPLYDTPYLDDRVNLGLKLLSNGALLLPFFVSFGSAPVGCYLLRSIDGGQQWSDPIEVPRVFNLWMALYGQVVELADGTLLLPAYGAQRYHEDVQAAVLHSTDGGENWSLRSIIAMDGVSFTEMSIVQLEGQELLAAIRDGDWHPMIYTTRSRDDGCTWDPPEPLYHGASPALFRRSNKHIVLGSADRAGITGVRVSLSTDDGATWPGSVLIDPDRETDIGYPAFVERFDGSLLAVSYKRYSGLRRAALFESFIAENPNFHNFFDGLEDESINDWQIWRLSGSPSMTGRVSPGRTSEQALFLHDMSGSQSVSATRTLYAFEQASGTVSFWIRPDSVANGIEFRLLSGTDALSAHTRFRFRVSEEATLDYLTYEGWPPSPRWCPMTLTGALPAGAWTKVEIGYRCADGEADIRVGGSFVGIAPECCEGDDITHLGFYAGLAPGTGARFLVDDLYASRYIAPGPFPGVGGETTAFPRDGPSVATFAQEYATPGTPVAFRESAVKNGGEILYQLSNDGGASWRWWNGEAWAPASGAGEANPAAETDSRIATLEPTGTIAVRAFLLGDGTHSVGLDELEIDVSSSVAAAGDGAASPRSFAAGPPAPNPSAGHAAFELSLPRPARARVNIFDASGRRVRAIRTPVLGPGRHRISWDCRTEAGTRVAAGVYYYSIEAGGGTARGRVTVVR